jgi:ubiquinone biosynthesis protein
MTFFTPIRQSYQEINRLRQIAEVLARHGLVALADQFGLERFLAKSWRRRARGEEVDEATMPVRLRKTVEELGPTFIKLGQVLSGRHDILPPTYTVELARLLDSAPPVAGEQIVARIEAELGTPLAELFASFDPSPIASASIGQAHWATLPNGQKVVVKVQRPGIEEIIQADLDLLRRQARFLERRSDTLKSYRLSELVEELGLSLQNELDYTLEGRNAERLRRNLQDEEKAVIPMVFWKLTTKRVITLQAVHGIKLNDMEGLRRADYDLAELAALTVNIYMRQVFLDGFFHADPHPANILVTGDGSIALVDFGTAGYLTPALRDALGDLLVSLLDQDAEGIVQTVLNMGAVERNVDRRALERDVQRLLHRYYDAPLEQMPVGRVLEDIMSLAYRHRIHLPSDLALLARMVIVLEGVALSLDPDFVFFAAARPFARRLIAERLSLRHLAGDLLRTLREASQLAHSLPRRLDSLADKLEAGEVSVGIDLQQMPHLSTKLDAVANRLAFSIVVAAIIISSAVLILGGSQVSVWHLPVVGWEVPIAQIGFITSIVLGAWLLISILRSRGL